MIQIQPGTPAAGRGATDFVHRITAPLNPLPRSVRRAGKYNLLDGHWSFAIDPADQGLEEKWYLAHSFTDRIHLPSPVESHLAGSTHAQIDPLICWFERDFTLPADWGDMSSESSPDTLELTFGACGFETQAWLNGTLLRTLEGEEIHRGEYTLFSCEIPTGLLNPTGQPNRLTVRTVDTLDADIPRGKQESKVYKRGGIWYQTISGPVRSIWLEVVPRNRLRSRLEVRSDIEEGLVEFSLNTRVRDAGQYTLTLHAWEREEDGDVVDSGLVSPPAAAAEFALQLQPGEQRHRLPMKIDAARVWGPGDPNLYHLRAELRDPSGRVSAVESNFGLRKVEARGRWICINNRPTYLDGILYQPNTSSFEQIVAHMQAIARLGCNMTRIHIAGVDPRIYDLADQMGMMLWVEVPSPHNSSEKSRAHHWEELQRMLPLLTAHPSVCILSLYNEDWGIEDVADNPQTREYIARAYAYLKVHYPQLLVVDNDGWKHVSSEGRLQADLLTAHIYTPSVERWGQKLDLLASGDMHCLWSGDWHQDMVVGDAFHYGGQTPLLVSEWGGFGWSGYGGPAESRDKAGKIREYKRELRKRTIAGDIYTQATHVEGEDNGIIDPETGELLVPEGILASTPPPPAVGDQGLGG